MNNEKLLDLTKVLMTLMTEGFVRVDGLRCTPVGGDEYIIAQGKKCASEPVIRWDSNNGVCAVVLPTGTVWVREGDSKSTTAHSRVRTAAGSIGVEVGCNVPLSNGESVSTRDMLRRVSDPEWVPSYHTTEEARKAGF